MSTSNETYSDPDFVLEDVLDYLSYDKITGLFVWTKFRHPKAYPGTVAGHTAQNRRGKVYVRIRFRQQIVFAHRLAFFMVTGEWPQGEVDHIDGDGTNNSWDNLRVTDRCVNNGNLSKLKSNNTSGVTGVMYHRGSGRWLAVLKHRRAIFHRSYHISFAGAVAARKRAEQALSDAEAAFSVPSEWAPDMPVAGEGRISKTYTK